MVFSDSKVTLAVWDAGLADTASTPGRRLYRRSGELRPVLDGLGISILTTPKGVMSGRAARKNNVGGEILCEVW